MPREIDRQKFPNLPRCGRADLLSTAKIGLYAVSGDPLRHERVYDARRDRWIGPLWTRLTARVTDKVRRDLHGVEWEIRPDGLQVIFAREIEASYAGDV